MRRRGGDSGGEGGLAGNIPIDQQMSDGGRWSDACAEGGGEGADALLGGFEPSGRRIGYQRDFWLVFTATSVLGLAANLFVFFPVYIVRLGGDAAAIGAIVSIGSLAALAARPALAPLIDWRGRR